MNSTVRRSQNASFFNVNPNSAARECIWYKRGFCKNGSSCKEQA